MRVIAPLTRPWAARKASSSWVSTSTRALPMPTTSMVAWSVTRGRLVGAATTDAAGRGWCQSWVACPSVPEQIPPPEALTPDVAAASTDANPHRLPRTVVPRRYDLTLEPDLDAATFGGHESITVEIVTATAEVGGERLVATVALDEESERVTLSFERALAAGEATLHLRFRGVLNDKLRGFYRSTFTDDAGVERVLATTQMEATDARRAFPCWDEPDAKAVFGITLVVPGDLLAISNAAELDRTPVAGGTDGGGVARAAVRFADTMPMSTYLVAFVVGPLVATDPVDVDGKPLRVVCPMGKEHLAQYALEVGAFALGYFTDWFG